MTLPLFVETSHCTSRLKCHLCQDAGKIGQQFRTTLATVYEMPGPGNFPCPFGEKLNRLPPPPTKTTADIKRAREAEWALKGPPLWRELHARPDAYAGDREAERKWWAGFVKRVGCGDCRRHAIQWAAENPMELASAEGLRAWGIALHNSVNVKLNKPLWTPIE